MILKFLLQIETDEHTRFVATPEEIAHQIRHFSQAAIDSLTLGSSPAVTVCQDETPEMTRRACNHDPEVITL